MIKKLYIFVPIIQKELSEAIKCILLSQQTGQQKKVYLLTDKIFFGYLSSSDRF